MYEMQTFAGCTRVCVTTVLLSSLVSERCGKRAGHSAGSYVEASQARSGQFWGRVTGIGIGRRRTALETRLKHHRDPAMTFVTYR